MDKFPQLELNNVPYYKDGQYWFPHFNLAEENLVGIPASCKLHDVTLRDGEQTPGITFLEDERVRIAELLDSVGVYRIEAGMPAVSSIQFNAVKRIAHAGLKAKIFAFCRAAEKDAQQVVDAGCSGIVVEHTANPLFCEKGYNLTPADVIKNVSDALKVAKKYGLYATYMSWDWFRSPIEWTKYMVEALLNEVEFDGLTIVDTYGNATPEAVYSMFTAFKGWFPNLSLEFHGHNDASLGIACSIAALKGGADVIHTAMNSLGERTGNVATEQLAYTGQTYYGIDMGVDLKAIYPAALTISKLAKTPINRAQPVIGELAYCMENGVATDLAMKLRQSCGISVAAVSPDVVGKPGGVKFVLGKNSGKNSIRMILAKYGLEATNEQISELTAMVKAEGVLTKDIVSDEQFLGMYHKIVG